MVISMNLQMLTPPYGLVDGYQRNQYDDPSANLWSTYLHKSEKHDKAMTQNWKGDMDAILIFAGLFSASVTAFIIESYKTLIPDPNDASVALLAQILQQIAALSNNSLMVDASALSSSSVNLNGNFSPSTSSLICNILWFLSLAFSLICALSATLVEQWTRQYLQASTSKPAPQDRARMAAYLYEGIKKYKMATIVEIIPMLLHISLFLFFGGLVAFLVALNSGLEYFILAILICCCTLYLLITILPVLELSCPYWTPLSRYFWTLLQKMQLLRRRDINGNEVPVVRRMSQAREIDAIEITPERDERDLKAMCWTINAQREDHEFEPFVEAIPGVVSGFDYSAKWLLNTLLNHEDISIKLGYRIPGLLATCNSGLLHPAAAYKRAVICLKSIWSLTMLSMPDLTKPASTSFRGSLRFKEDTLILVYDVQRTIPSVTDHALSTSTVVARNLLDTHIDRIIALEERLLNSLRSGWSSPAHIDPDMIYLTSSDRAQIVEDALRRIHKAEAEVSQSRNFTLPKLYTMLEALESQYQRIVSLATYTESGIDKELIHRIMDSLRHFYDIVNQAGFHLTLEYISQILESESLPHEAFNTLRRTYFRIAFKTFTETITPDGQILFNPSSRKIILPKDSQSRLVAYLEEAVEATTAQGTRLPHTIINIILELTQVLTDTDLISKAIRIVKNYSIVLPNDAALRTLQALEKALPRNSVASSPPLDLFNSHVYTDVKPNRQSIKTMSRSNTLASSQTLRNVAW